MIRTPVEGQGHDPTDKKEFVSLSLGLDRLEAQARATINTTVKPGLKVGVAMLPRVVESLYRKFFGARIPSTVMRGDVASKALKRCAEILTKEKLDTVTWVTAQLDATTIIKDFQPQPYAILNMLSGEAAMRRYNGFIHRANKRLHHATSKAFESDTAYWKFVASLAREEDDVATDFVMCRVAGEAVTWDDIVSKVSPSALWLKTRYKADPRTVKEYQDKFGARKFGLALEIVKLRVAAQIACQFRAGLDNWVGFSAPFNWEDFAALLVRLYPRQPLPASAVPSWEPSIDSYDVGLTDEELDA